MTSDRMKLGQRLSAAFHDPYFLALCLIVVMGFVLRVSGVTFGLPFTYHMDEGFEVNRALQLASGSFDFSRIAKGGYFYVLFVEFGFMFVFMKLAGFVDTTREFALWFVRDPSWFYLVGRITTATIGTVCLILTYRLGERFQSKLVGLLAALLLCFNILHAQNSHYITVDIPLTCLCLAAMLFILGVADGKGLKSYIWAGVFIALASTTKLPGIILMLPFFMAHMISQMRNGNSFFASIFEKNWIKAMAAFLVVYLVTTPGIVINFKPLMATIFGIYGLEKADATEEAGGDDFGDGPDFDPLGYYLDAIIRSMGLFAFGLGLAGMVAGVIKERVKGPLLVVFVVTFFAALALSARADLAYHRYVLPFLPMFLVLAAGVVVWVGSLITQRLPMIPLVPLTLALSLVTVVPGASEITDMNQRLLAVDSRTLAKNWFEQNVAENSKVLIEGFSAQVFRGTTPLLNTIDNTKRAIEEFKATGQKGKAKYYEFEIEAKQGKRYDLNFYLWETLRSLDEYKAEKIDYIVVRPKFLLETVKYYGIGEPFYKALRSEPEYTLVASFEGEAGGGVGPSIEIYKRVGAE